MLQIIKRIISGIIFGKKTKIVLSPSCKIFLHGSGKIEGDNSSNFHSRCSIEVFNNSQLKIASGVECNVDSRIQCSGNIVIGADVVIGPRVFISNSNHNYKDISKPIKNAQYVSSGDIFIDSETWIGAGAIILGGVSIGKHCVIGAGTVVTKDVPDYSVCVGNPGRIISHYDQVNKVWGK